MARSTLLVDLKLPVLASLAFVLALVLFIGTVCLFILEIASFLKHSKEFAIELGVGTIPEWVYSLAYVGAGLDDLRLRRQNNKSSGGIPQYQEDSSSSLSSSSEEKCDD
eukprot:13065599-Ditylum_brightwellii.AAC.1